MTVLTEEQQFEEIKRICDEEFGAGNTPDWLVRDISNFTDRQKQAYAEQVAKSPTVKELELAAKMANLEQKHVVELEQVALETLENFPLDCGNCGKRTTYLEADLRQFNTGMCGGCGADALRVTYREIAKKIEEKQSLLNSKEVKR